MTAILATDDDGGVYVFLTDSMDDIEKRSDGEWNWKSGKSGPVAGLGKPWQMENVFGAFHEQVKEALKSVPIPAVGEDPLEIDINFKTSINWY